MSKRHIIQIEGFNPQAGKTGRVRFSGLGHRQTTMLGTVLERYPTILLVKSMGEEVFIHKQQVLADL